MKRVLIFFALVATVEAGWFNGQGVRVDGPQSIVFTNPSPSVTLATYITNATAAATNQTLAAILTNGNNAAGINATNLGSIGGSGIIVFGIGFDTSKVDSTAYGAQQLGSGAGYESIGVAAYGAQQRGQQNGTSTINNNASGSDQCGWNNGLMIIGAAAHGASQRGKVDSANAYNYAIGAMQLMDLTSGQHATSTVAAAGSILLGAGTASNRYSIVAGDSQVSHGDGSITAGGGFFGSGAGLTGLLLNDGSYLVSSWTGSTNTLKIVSPTGAYTNTIATTP